ncbi:MAG: heparinase II/III family protein [Alistipes sp.]|nr:heparinase II/III family protein [Alistipes sp.]
MKNIAKIVIFLSILFVGGRLCAHNITAEMMSDMKPHPRLLLREGDVERVCSMASQVPQVEALYDYVMKRADLALEGEVCGREKRGRRLLAVSRLVLERVLSCSCAYLLTGDGQYAERAEAEMVAAARFEDWNPSHFLDVGEMVAALAIGYDWLYDVLSEQSRSEIESAIIEKGLLGAEDERQMWFYRRENNWNQVCNGGLVMGALAIADRNPELAAKIVKKSLSSISYGLRPYAPDGVYPEGYAYWNYGTWYQVMMIESLRSALGDSFGLEKSDGFLQSAYFMNFMVAPSGRSFNFSDSGAGSSVQSNLLLAWFASELNDMALVYRDMEVLKRGKFRVSDRRFSPLALFYLGRCDFGRVTPIDDNFWYGYGEQPLFIYRGGWGREDDAYLAAKGGSPSSNHAHMDGGSFVYEWGGVRWSSDLGSQDYHSLESRGVKLWAKGQHSPRWDVFRLNNFSHSTLTVDGEKHLYEGRAEMVEVYDSPKCYGATFDLTSLLSGVESAKRKITIDESGQVAIDDEVVAGRSAELRWTMCTPAEAVIHSDRTILLESKGRRLRVEVLSPSRVKPFILSNDPPHDYDAPNKGSRRVGFVVRLKPHRHHSLQVRLVPES